VIIFCKGMPGTPRADETLEFWAKKGFWVFFPRYRGTWESDGEFLKRSPHEDILDVIDELPKGFTDLWFSKRYMLNAKRLYVFGGSFGGPAAILLSRDPRVTKAVAFAPVIDWMAPSKDEPMDKLGVFIPKGFGNCYRFSKRNWKRLSENKFYSPVKETDTIDGKKLLIFHAKDDGSCDYGSTKKFAAKTGAKLITLRTGGHFGFSKSTEPKIYKEIRKFLAK
jgi:pimeloyl-ACP methyl ester carboxylesterase